MVTFYADLWTKFSKDSAKHIIQKGNEKKMKYAGLCQFVTTYFIIEHFSTFAFYVI